MSPGMGPFVAFVIITSLLDGVYGAPYFGKFLGKLSELHHGVSGEVYAVDGRTLYVKDFTYDGQGPAAYFYASSGRNADRSGFRLRDENGSPEVIRRYRKEGLTLTLPEGKTLNNIKIFYVWCEDFDVNFGDVKIPRNFDYPRPQRIDALKGVHAISSDSIVIVDAQTLLIPHLSYDGEAPDAKFWVGRGAKPSPQGIRVSDENGKELPLRRYDRKTVVLTLPGDLTVSDIGHFGIWCEAFTVDFGHVLIPHSLNVPPSLKMLGVSPQSKLNCEVLYDDLAFEVRWAVAGDSIVLQLVAKLDEREYMSFGLSGDDTHTEMINGDVVVAWVDKTTLKGYAEDYHLAAKSQCSGPTGSCPDLHFAENTNNIRLLNAAMVNGYSIVTYQRPLKPSDEYDRQIHTNRSQAIIWAIGPLNQKHEVSFHAHFTKSDRLIDFGRSAKWNCPMPEGEMPTMKAALVEEEITAHPPATSAPSKQRTSERRRGSASRGTTSASASIDAGSTRSRNRGASRRTTTTPRPAPTPAAVSKRDAWSIPAIKCDEPEDGVFYAQMGPTGGKRGYPAITGHVGWGISWYINGLLIPEINVVRGKTYTFVVEGGSDPEVPAKYHPFYITDDEVGGYEYKTEEERKKVEVYAGLVTRKDGSSTPAGTGRLCHWTQQGDIEADDFESFGAYQRNLELKCDEGEPGVIQWTPDRHTPDTVYYQCFTHRYLGWKINVLDACDAEEAGSEPQGAIVRAPDLAESASQSVETRVKANELYDNDKEDNVKTSSTTSVSDLTSTVLPLTDPTSSTSPEQAKSPPSTESFLTHTNNFYTPPPLFMGQGQFINTLNPYLYENPFYFNPYQQQLTFKPSPPLDTLNEGGFKPHTLDTGTEAPTSSLPLLSSTTTTTTTTTGAPTISTTLLNTIADKLLVSASEVKPQNQSYLLPPKFAPFPTSGVLLRRPPPPRRPLRPPMRSKKPIYRPHMKIVKRPYISLQENLFFADQKRRPPNFILLKPHPIKHPTTPKPLTVTVTNVEKQQASTEREPEIQTAPPRNMYSNFRMPPAMNTGFHPESVVVEGGFKPIVSKELQRRMDDDEAGPIGVANHVGEATRPDLFGPMFVPSPVDQAERAAAEDSMAMPAERVEAYYLPPAGRPPQLGQEYTQLSSIDFPPEVDQRSPPDVVVTYDGKRVSGASLTKIGDRSSAFDTRASKAAEFIKARPQFVPFKGELPPLGDLAVDPASLPQIRGLGLDAPTTRLKPARGYRAKRAPHHTPEHTEQQGKSGANGPRGSYRVLLVLLGILFYVPRINAA